MTYKILLEDGKFKAHMADETIGSVVEQQERLRSAIQRASAERKPLVLHLHGGLVRQALGENIADRLAGKYEASGGVPLFFVWKTGFIENIRTNYREALDARLIKWAVRIIIKKLKSKIKSTGKALQENSQSELGYEDVEFEESDILQLHAELVIDSELDSLSKDLVNGVKNELDSDPLTEKQFRAILHTSHTAQEQDKREASTLNPELFKNDEAILNKSGAISISSLNTAAGFKLKVIEAIGETILGVLGRYKAHTDHGIHATIIEELSRRLLADTLGSTIWEFMKKDAAQAFDPGSDHVGRYFLDCLQEANPRPRVQLIGHSAGSIFICELLKSASSGPFDVALLAPAVTYEKFAKTVTEDGQKIANFRMFTMKDEFEKADALVNNLSFLYPSSLLYLISGILERDGDSKPDIDKPILGMERFYRADYKGRPGDQTILNQVRDYLKSRDNSVIWSVSQGDPGLNSAAIDHGCFDNEPNTVISLQYLISNGYGNG